MAQQYTGDNENSSKLLKGILIGGIVGGALMLLDSSTRRKITDTALNLKDSSVDMYSQVKENPSEVKEQMIDRFKSASDTLKEAISDAQTLYETVNENVFSKVTEVKDISSDALSTAKDATEELKGLGGKVAEAGSQLAEIPSAAMDSSSNESSSGSSVSSANNTSSKNSTNSTNF